MQRQIDAAVNRLMTFQEDTEEFRLASAEVDAILGQHEQVALPILSEDTLLSCVLALEESALPDQEAGAPKIWEQRALCALKLLANASLVYENRSSCVSLGVPGTCVVLLQQHAHLSASMLYHTFDLMSTLASGDGSARVLLRPSIPYVIAAMKEHTDAVEVLLGGAVVLGTLALLDHTNGAVIIQCDGVQTLISCYHAAQKLSDGYSDNLLSLKRVNNIINAQKSEVLRRSMDDCAGAKRWCKDTLLKLAHVPSSKEVDNAFKSATYGQYGASVELDELKWLVTFERKKSTR